MVCTFRIFFSRKEAAKAFMREAGLEAGLCSKENPDQMRMALESEVASIFCSSEHKKANSFHSDSLQAKVPAPAHHKSKHYSKPSNTPRIKHLVIDLGGGTADLTMHCKKDDSDVLDQWQSSKGGPWGALKINLGFEKLMGEIFGESFRKSI